jgi:phosphoglucosamine mutase
MTWLTRDWERKLLALVVACTLWLFAVSGDRSEVALAAPVEFVNVPPGLVRTGATVERVIVRVDGLRSTLARLSDGGLRAEVDLGGLGPGEASVRLGPDDVRAPRDVNVVGVSPARLAVVLEPLAVVRRPVAPSLVGTAGLPRDGGPDRAGDGRARGTGVAGDRADRRGLGAARRNRRAGAGEPDGGAGAGSRRPAAVGANGRGDGAHRGRPVSRLFGTDGIRGVANEEPLTPELAFRIGRELAAELAEQRAGGGTRIVVGRDTRRSGPLLESALVAGALSAGADCYTVGVLPTPGIAFMTQALEAHGGVVLSASHNPFEDNGIKLFSSEGTKFPDAWEDDIERRLAGPDRAPRAHGAGIGRLVAYGRAEHDYGAFLRRGFPHDLRGLTIVLDCAHGATYRVAPRVFRALGARVVTAAARPDGTNINRGCGALHPGYLVERVRAAGADLGLAFDGDGDRLIAVDATGTVRDGDFALAICARHLAQSGKLRGNMVVTTVMANLGLDRALAEAGISLVKTQVGDRYVYEEMRRIGANLGGEQSGHLLFLDHAPAGDGILSGLQLLAIMRETGQSLETLSAILTKFPQVLVNVPVRAKPPIETVADLIIRVRDLEATMNGAGRILVRYSGTEPIARIMIEGPAEAGIDAMAADLAALIRREIGA